MAAGAEGQRDGKQGGGDDRPQQQHGLLPAQARVQAARLREDCAPARVPPGHRLRRTRIFSPAGISSPAGEIASWESSLLACKSAT